MPGRTEPFIAVGLRVADLSKALSYWVDLMGLQQLPTVPGIETADPSALVGFSPMEAGLQLIQVADGLPVDHAQSSGRIAFACASVLPIFEKVKASGDIVQTPPLTLPTPGKVRKRMD